MRDDREESQNRSRDADRNQRNDQYPHRYNDELNGGYNDLENKYRDQDNSSKYENFDGGGYYGANYGIDASNSRGRDIESNAGYRDSYERLTTGEWPEIADARRRRAELEHRDLPAGVTHRGKGPRSYQRPDARIREDIHDLLREDPYVDATDVEIAVQGGEVVLSGIVEDKQTKRRIEDIVDSISGVKEIQNKLRPRLSDGRIVNIRNRQG